MKAIIAATLALTLVSGTAFAAGDAAKGEKVFQKCKACHTAEKGGANKLGPNLWGVVGRKSASLDGFNYSPAMKNAGKTWDAATLDTYLTKPQALVPGTRMAFPGLPDAGDRADVIAYLSTLK